MLASHVPMIAAADPKAAERKKKKVVEKVDDGKSMEEKWASLLAESEGVDGNADEAVSTATPAAKGKRRAKKA
jgi:signal peptidase complex subunit 2